MPVFCKNCKYRNEVHTMHGSIISNGTCGKTVTVTAPETFYSRQQKKQLSAGLKIQLNHDGNCQHYKPMFWFWRWWTNLV